VTAPDKQSGRAPQKSPRRRAREFVVQGLYQHMVGGQDEAAIRVQAESVAGFDKSDTALYSTLLSESLGNLPALRDSIAPHVDRTWDEVSPIERSILLVGACELQHHPETPYRVVINEAIELAKTFGGTDGHKFINGILDKLAPLLRPNEAQGR
jgi:transcription antitermination protein NusB